MSTTPLHVAVVSRYELVRGGIAHLLGTEPGRALVSDAAGQDGYHVVVFDLGGVAVPDELSHLLQGDAPVVALQPAGRTDLARAALALGVSAVVPMSVTAAQLIDALEGAAGRRPTSRVTQLGHSRHELRSAYHLTDRELDILELIASGLSNTEIADRLFLSINSIKSYIRTAYRKMGVQTRAQAVLWIVQHGLEPVDTATSD